MYTLVTFWGGDRRFRTKHPIVNDLLHFDISAGVIEFNGHFYLEDEHLPQEYRLDIRDYDEATQSDTRRVYCHIRVVRREVFEDTSEYWDDPDAGGDICLFPTNRIRLHFVVTKQYNDPIPPPCAVTL